MNKKYKLFSHIIPVLGYKKGLVCDLYRERMYSLPVDLISIITQNSVIGINDLVKIYGEDNEDTIKEYVDFLIQKELVHSVDDKIVNNFPPLSLEWDSPSLITNAIIEVGNKTTMSFIDNALKELQLMGCKALGLVLDNISLELAYPIISYIDNQYNFIIELSLDYKYNVSEEFVINKVSVFNKVVKVIVNGSGYEKIVQSTKYNYLTFQWTKTLPKEATCTAISENSFRVNMQYFFEAQNHNTCLNRKICIDSKGDFKICLKMDWHCGNIENHSLNEIINKSELTKYWILSKKNVDVCKDCEYRYSCRDCRANVKDPENIYSQPAKCTYNPYIAKWQGEEGYVPVEECGTYSRETGFVVNPERVAELNSQIWGE